MIHHEKNIDLWHFIIYRNHSISQQESLDVSRSWHLDYDGKFYDDDQQVIRILQMLQHLSEWLVCLRLGYGFCEIASSDPQVDIDEISEEDPRELSSRRITERAFISDSIHDLDMLLRLFINSYPYEYLLNKKIYACQGYFLLALTDKETVRAMRK